MKSILLSLVVSLLTITPVSAQQSGQKFKTQPECVADEIMIAPTEQFYFGKTFSSFDTNTDDRISFEEFLDKSGHDAERQSEERKAQVMRSFVALDKDADGYLLREDWYEAKTCAPKP